MIMVFYNDTVKKSNHSLTFFYVYIIIVSVSEFSEEFYEIRCCGLA